MQYNYSHHSHLAARAEAFNRSKGVCQLCGSASATEGHHWATQYPKEFEMTGDDLTALCDLCHLIATTLRRFHGSRFEFEATFKETIEKCYTRSKSLDSLRSFITAQRDSIPSSLPTSKKPPSLRNGARTARPPTMPDSANLKHLPVYGSTRKTNLRFPPLL